jgi:hypothetical protein
MNWDAIGAIGEILGAIAVFASLIYLAIQIRNSTKQFRAQMEDDLQQRSFEAYNPTYEGNNAHILRVGLVDPENLDDDQMFVFDLLVHRHLGVLYTMSRRVRTGQLGEDVYEGYLRHYKHKLFTTIGGSAWLEENAEYLKSDSDLAIIYKRLREDV